MVMVRDNKMMVLTVNKALVSSVEFRIEHVVPSVEFEDVKEKGHQQ
jgi:hypothetical protein